MDRGVYEYRQECRDRLSIRRAVDGEGLDLGLLQVPTEIAGRTAEHPKNRVQDQFVHLDLDQQWATPEKDLGLPGELLGRFAAQAAAGRVEKKRLPCLLKGVQQTPRRGSLLGAGFFPSLAHTSISGVRPVELNTGPSWVVPVRPRILSPGRSEIRERPAVAVSSEPRRMKHPHPWLASLLTFLQVILTAQAGPGQDEQLPPPALIVPIQGEISTVTLALVTRAARQAEDIGAKYLVLEISSQGGSVDAMRGVQKALQALRSEQLDGSVGASIATVAYIDDFAWSAAAMIALTCDQVYMRPNSSIGAATVVAIDSLTGRPVEIPKDMRDKETSVNKALMRSAVEGTPRENKNVLTLVEAMMDPEMELYRVIYRGAGGLETGPEVVERAELDRMQADPDITFSVPPEEFNDRPLSLTPAEAVEFGVADGRVESLEFMLRDYLFLESSEWGRMEESWSEGTAAWLNDMRGVLYVLGFILLLIELKTPGFAVPGILGIILFGLAFSGGYMVGLASITEIILFYIGLGLLAVEIFVFPGMIVFGLAGFVSIVFALIWSQQTFYFPGNEGESDVMLNNFINFGGILLFVMVGIWAVYTNIHRIPILRAAVQSPPKTHGAGTFFPSRDEERLVQIMGKVGVLGTDLRPSGRMEIDGEHFDVVSEGGYIDKGTSVEVIQVRGNRVVVARAKDTGDRGQVGVIVLLLITGLALIIAEVFFVSFGVLAIISSVAIISAIFLAYGVGTWTGNTVLVLSAVGVPLSIKYAFKWLPYTPMGRHFYLDGSDPAKVSGAAQQTGLEELVGKTGVALSDLRPSGYAEIDGRRRDVITRGELLDGGSPIQVIKVELNQIVVGLDQSNA